MQLKYNRIIKYSVIIIINLNFFVKNIIDYISLFFSVQVIVRVYAISSVSI